MKPVIGITTGLKVTDLNGAVSCRIDISAWYSDAVVAAGGTPVILPPIAGTEQDVFSFVDGLIFSGGADVDPALFGDDTVHPETYGVDEARDTFELALARSAYERDVPVLGICRGIQLLNVALGGTLIQHVPDLTEIEHRQNTTEIPPQSGIHAVELVPGSVVAGVYGTESLQTNSFHHQALKDVAAPFVVSGRSADGMIEAVEANEKGCFFAVQWHPEMMHAHDTLQLAPFTRLVEKSSSRRLAPTGD
jgi:putative glutamine amidotransferase